ncbi:MAG: hypothetical protein CMQ05_12660 [Gammaproteobacteria bacterium]|nr:hypothetical protein [Gammaproteobacteria bacterium]
MIDNLKIECDVATYIGCVALLIDIIPDITPFQVFLVEINKVHSRVVPQCLAGDRLSRRSRPDGMDQ